jgi:curved DNA-binding protein
MAKDFYQVLGVDRNADEKDIKKAFRKLAKKHHPDANPNDASAEQRFKEINEAYEALGDPEKRKFYDAFGADYARYQSAGINPDEFARGAGQPPFNFDDYVRNNPYQQRTAGGGTAFDDMFETIFGGFGRNPKTGNVQVQARGRDITREVTITLREAYDGAIRYITRGDKRVKVNIPAGADTGTKVRLEKQGEPGMMGGEAGDLFLVITVEPDATFQRHGDDLTVHAHVDMFTALLGGEIAIPTLNREVMVKVQAGTQSGQKLRVRGKGMPKLKQKGEYGDMFVVIQVNVPKALTPQQRQLVEQLRDSFQ